MRLTQCVFPFKMTFLQYPLALRIFFAWDHQATLVLHVIGHTDQSFFHRVAIRPLALL